MFFARYLYDLNTLWETNECHSFRLFLKNKSGAFRLAGLAGLGLLTLSYIRYIYQNKNLRAFRMFVF